MDGDGEDGVHSEKKVVTANIHMVSYQNFQSNVESYV
jgi:hypothetical protein